VPKPKASTGPQDVVGAFYEWVSTERGSSDVLHAQGFEAYFHGVAEARYVIRKVFRMVDDQAKHMGLEPLEHQALIQIFGAPAPLRVIDVADRLDIAPAFASRLAKALEGKGLVTRSPSADDRRSTYVEPTLQAREVLASIDERVAIHVGHFKSQLSTSERAAALGIFAFYVGASHVEDLESLIGELMGRDVGQTPRR
jgi:DNA-binding MarR family transcriptional regulator